jgi:hypothetical protein
MRPWMNVIDLPDVTVLDHFWVTRVSKASVYE